MFFSPKNKKRIEKGFGIIAVLVIISMILLYAPGLF
jgi:hypothetical protein